ncbi:MAG: hypothetical protein CSB47_09550 [Proteobacteria bacterium]|nr:MAG: hypothetical protein CSB47_09550 [Pseudomonadota bacterium]
MALKIGRYLVILGFILTVVGLIAGFGLMFKGVDDWAKFFLMIVPIGFMVGFAGFTATLMSSPEKRRKFDDSL